MIRLNHALHNEELCRKLRAENNFLDWVIVSAFYSALHYSEYELFPFQIGKGIYKDFDEYYKVLKSDRDNRHAARQRLVYSNISALAGAAYHWLKQTAWSARYYNYVFDESDANIALEKLDIIKSCLSKSLTVQKA